MDTNTGPAATAGDGIVTVAFVDVEGSTALVDRLGDHFGIGAVSRQLEHVRDCIASYGGREVKSLGDGLLIVFSSPRQAVTCALAVQRALAGSRPRLRIGINAGEVIDRDADPMGAAVNAAARIVARADGGEVLVSDVVRQLVGMVPTVRFVDRGRVRLKGFVERWRLWTAQDTASTRARRVTVGRAGEQATLRELIESAMTGTGGVAVVEGEPGIGKSHLVGDAVDIATEAGVVVVHAIADEVMRRAGVLPHALLRQPAVPAPFAETIRDVLAGRVPGVAADLSFVVIDATVDAVEAITRVAPVLVVFDDAQWADELSVGVLRALVARASTAPFAVLVALRPTPRPPALDRLIDAAVDGGGSHVRLGPLKEIDVHALSTVVTGAAPGELLRDRLRATSGNPLFATEFLRSLDEEGLVRIEAGVAEITDASTPAGLSETLVRRLSWLPAETRDLLQLASLLGASFTLSELATVTQRSVIEIAAGLREASLAGLIIGDGDRLAFRHDLVRDAVYDHMLPAERRDLHRVSAIALAAAGAPVQQVAVQFGRGALRGDLEAVGWLRRAADELVGFASSTAVDLYNLALDLAPQPWPERDELMVKLIEPLAACGRFTEAEQLGAEVLASNPSDDVAFAALRGLGAVHGNRGDISQAITMFEQASSMPGARESESERLRCITAQMGVVTGVLDAEEGRRRTDHGLARGLDMKDADLQCTAHQATGCIASMLGFGLEALDHFQTATALFDMGRVTPDAYLIPDLFAAMELTELDQLDEAIAKSAGLRQRYAERGMLSPIPMSYGITAWALCSAGRYDDAIAELEAAVSISHDIGSHTFLVYFDALQARIALHRGDVTAAQLAVAAGFDRLEAGRALFGVDLLVDSNIQLLDATGDVDGALALAEVIWQQTAFIRLYYGARERTVTMASIAMRLGRRDLATEAAETMDVVAERRPCGSTRAAALQCRGLLEDDPDQLLAGVAAFRPTPMRPAHALCCEHAAAALGASDRAAAIALLEEAGSIHTALGAIGDLARIDGALEALTGRSRVSRPKRPTFGWESLTPTELSVSQQVAEGLSNPEIAALLYISRRTVESHLAHIFRKLGISGRAQLAVEVTRRS